MSTRTHLTPDAKADLSRTIRALRERLLREIREHADGLYRLSIKDAQHAGLGEVARTKRRRLEGWLDERVRAVPAKERGKARERFLGEAVKEAAHTLVNRLVLVRHLEALGLSKPAVVTGGWKSVGYKEWRDFAPALCDDDTEGYGALIGLVFDELAVELPGLFGDVGLTRLFPIPAQTLRAVVEALDAPALASAWGDDTTLGWVYQYWNDPEREALDAKLNDGGKVEPHEIASKTQMFTERYMVEWLLQNSLGATWLCMCKKHGWTPEAESVLPVLEARRADWRARRDRGEVALDALMPIEAGLEDRWKYYVPQPLPDAAVEAAPRSIRDLKLLDPACGSGHFLVIAFDLLAALYREEARHTNQDWSDRQIAAWILEDNLHGVDIDPRAIQIAAAGLYLKAKALHPKARPARVNLVAPDLKLAALPKDDPALVALRRELKAEAGLPEALTDTIVGALKGADHLGSLLKVDAAIEDAIRAQERAAVASLKPVQGDLLTGFPAQQAAMDFAAAKETVLDRLERFLAAHAAEEDLGLRLDGEQLAAGVRFVRMMKEGTYDVVVGNPPYQGTSRMADAAYVANHYPRGKADLFAAFLERGLELVRRGGVSGLLTMRGWMFLGQFEALRKHLLHEHDLRCLGDVDRGAFDEVPNEVLAAAMAVVRRSDPGAARSVAVQPTPLSDKSYDRQRTNRKRAAVLAQVGRYEFDTKGFEAIEGEPVVYWWTPSFLLDYRRAAKLGDSSPARFGLTTGDNGRFVRFHHEVRVERAVLDDAASSSKLREASWVPFVLGGKGRVWFEPLRDVCRWVGNGLEVKEKCVSQYGTVSKQVRNEDVYFERGIAFAMIGNAFSGRVHRYRSVIGNMGSSVYPVALSGTLCIMNTSLSRMVLESINPGVHFEVGDVNRLPIFPVESADAIFANLDRAFTEHEAAREASVEFKQPGPSPWSYAQDWAQRAVDRAAGDALPSYEPTYDPPAPEAELSFAFGVAMGRFGANGEGLLDEAPASALPSGLLFLSAAGEHDSLARPAAAPLRAAWDARPEGLTDDRDLGEYLRKSYFAWVKKTYENRPIYLPLSSKKKSFVAWASIHRFGPATLATLLADHLLPEKKRLEGLLEDLRRARKPDGTATARERAADRAAAEKRFATTQDLLAELDAFIAAVTECAEKGPPPADASTTKREADARYEPDLDDGVMVNSAALWPLLEPQWKDPKKWWKELANAEGRKDYDWSHLAARYFPTRVATKCKEDPSLAVAHGCFWREHPAKAYAWELRLQDEIRPGFTIDEPGSDEARARFLKGRAEEARAIEAAEAKRRERKAKKADEDEGAGPLFDPAEEGDG